LGKKKKQKNRKKKTLGKENIPRPQQIESTQWPELDLATS
jgi:hypothetical protein